MDIKDIIREELWKIVKPNYEKESYSTAIKDLCIYMNDIIREKTELSLDGTALMDKAFMGVSPLLKVNDMNTQTEKDIQQGVGFFLKGMCLSIRNPRSHSIYSDSKENADKIIILIDYLYSFISSSKQNVLIDDWVEFLKSDAFPTDLEYAKLLIKQVSKHNSINIIIEILKNINKFNIDKINNFFKILLSTLSSSDNIILVDYINKLLINENHGFNLIPYFSLLNNEIWTKLDKIVTLKMERAIIDTLFSNEEIYHYSEDGKYLEKSNLYYLIKSIEPYLEIFDNKEEIYDGLFLKTLKDDIRVYIRILSDFRNIFYSDYFVFEYNSFMGNMIDNIRKDIKNKLNPSLDIAKSKVYKVRDSKWIKTFLEDIEKINNSSEAKNGDLPF